MLRSYREALTQWYYRQAIVVEVTDYPEDFDSWLARVHLNDAVMFLLYQIYQLDMIGKVNKENMIVSLRVKKASKPVTPETMDQFSSFIASGALDVYLDRKKSE